MHVGRWIPISLLCVTLVVPLFTKGNVTNICDHWIGKEDRLIKIDNSIGKQWGGPLVIPVGGP